ncbi:2-phosphosulfolactate phosphatase [Brevibacillus fulvus]|uniref:Probable 2-phosphosulfolactate phosphatase n=1 Tax=Brevibacillus fulvus TaxID=1125967 RepID=A0A938XVP4_9BACL|nr:2-phosphosulfolactate phosphatase [Brevibacillus fulvus]MBM7588568.1 2-phosphosulfolactate phosphatase [Brevibacillus fulvus]
MRLDIVPIVEETHRELVEGRIVVVIDVLRASSTIVTALASGFASVIPVDSAERAWQLRSPATVLAGERFCEKIPHFDCNNSPTELLARSDRGKQLVLTTTNGTRAIEQARLAHAVLIGCFLNASATIRHALSYQRDITLLCAGTRAQFALEDGLAAGCMTDRAKQLLPQLSVCDFAEAMSASYLYERERLRERLEQTTTGRRLLQHGFTADLDYCSQLDRVDLVPLVKETSILPHLVS